jgi:transposase
MSDGDDLDLPDIVIGVIAELCEQLLFLHEKIASYSLKMAQVARREKRVALLQTIPPLVHVNMHCQAAGIGPITASAIVAAVGTGKQFGSDRDFAAWLGLTPLNRSGGGRERLGRISTLLMVCRQTTAGQWMGDRYIRRLLVLGMMSRMRQITKNPERYDPWVADILARKPGKVAAVAITAREGRIKPLVLSGPS